MRVVRLEEAVVQGSRGSRGALSKIKVRLRQDAGIGGGGAENGAVVAGTGKRLASSACCPLA